MVSFEDQPTSDPSQLPNGYPVPPRSPTPPAAPIPIRPHANSALPRAIEVEDITDLPNGVTPISSQQTSRGIDDFPGAVQPVSQSSVVASRGIVVEPEGVNDGDPRQQDHGGQTTRPYPATEHAQTGVDPESVVEPLEPIFGRANTPSRPSRPESPSAIMRRSARYGPSGNLWHSTEESRHEGERGAAQRTSTPGSRHGGP